MDNDELVKKNRKLRKQVKSLKEQITQAQVPADVPESVPEPADEYERLRVRKTGGRVWWQVGAGAGLAVAAILMLFLYTKSSNNMFLAIMFIVFAGGAFTLILMGLRKRDEGMFLKPSKKKIFCELCEQVYDPVEQHAECPHTKIVPNCLNIYYGWDEAKQEHYCDRIAFEEMKKSEIVTKHPQRCLDDGKWYYVQIHDGKENKFIPFYIPDMIYYSPKEFPNALQMPLSRKYAKPRATLGEKLRPIVIVAILGIEAFIMLISATPGG